MDSRKYLKGNTVCAWLETMFASTTWSQWQNLLEKGVSVALKARNRAVNRGVRVFGRSWRLLNIFPFTPKPVAACSTETGFTMLKLNPHSAVAAVWLLPTWSSAALAFCAKVCRVMRPEVASCTSLSCCCPQICHHAGKSKGLPLIGCLLNQNWQI